MIKYFLFLFSAFILLSACSNDSTPIESQKENIVCKILTNKAVYKVGGIPDIVIIIQNISGDDILWPQILDGSISKNRYPYYYFTIYDKSGLLLTSIPTIASGSIPLVKENFFLLQDMASFSPSSDQILKEYKDIFNHPGHYTLVFNVSTEGKEIEKWGGYDEAKNSRAEIQNIIDQIPKEHVQSNALRIEFKV